MISKSKKKYTGNLKQRVTVQRYTTASDDGFGDTQEWSDLTEIWTNITPLSGQKRLAFAQLDSTVTHEIKARHGVSITNQDRIKFGERIFTIKFLYNEDEESYFDYYGAAEEV